MSVGLDMTGRPLVMHIIPGLGTGGAEHTLASLVTANRQQPFRQVATNLLSGSDFVEQPKRLLGRGSV